MTIVGGTMVNYRQECSSLLYDYLMYHINIKNHSQKTVREYFFDLRLFFRYLIWVQDETQDFDSISIKNIDLKFVEGITTTDIYNFLSWLSTERNGGESAASRARRLMSIRSFYHYLVVTKELLPTNIAERIDSPKLRKSLPKFLSESDAKKLIDAADGKFASRDRAIMMIMMGCGLRVSEVVSLNMDSIQDDGGLRVLGKGNKERMVYMPDFTLDCLNEYLQDRRSQKIKDDHEKAVFISNIGTRLNVRAIQKMMDRTLLKAGLDVERYSPHKLRHTAATEMVRNGVDVRVVQEVLGHEHLSTTQIYTHVENTDLKIAAKANKIGEKP